MPTIIENFRICVEVRHADGSGIVGQVGKADAKAALHKAEPDLFVLLRDAGVDECGALHMMLAVPRGTRPKAIYNRVKRAAERVGLRVS